MTDEATDSNNRPPDSEFSPSTFQDTDFSKHSFIDLNINSRPQSNDREKSGNDEADQKDQRDQQDPRDQKDQPKLHTGHKADDGDGVSLSEDKKGEKDRHYDELMQLLMLPTAPGPNDWVPAKLDPLQNGGFTIAPDNGSPVPYRLNGHVDLERGRPCCTITNVSEITVLGLMISPNGLLRKNVTQNSPGIFFQ